MQGVQVGVPLAEITPSPLVDHDSTNFPAVLNRFEQGEYYRFDLPGSEVAQKSGRNQIDASKLETKRPIRREYPPHIDDF